MTETDNANKGRGLFLRLVVAGLVLAAWFGTQSLIGARTLEASGIGDALHNLTAGMNSYFSRTPAAANALLVASSALIDAFGLFALGSWLWGGTIRPFLGLILLMGLRQTMQALCVLPAPANMIWHYPGFPSLLVTYNVANDFFFSGHTAIAVFGALELSRFHRTWLTSVGGLIVLFEATTVLILRAHYTMDVFTGLLAALFVAQLTERLSPRVDRFFSTAH
jgi:hypothetical protein